MERQALRKDGNMKVRKLFINIKKKSNRSFADFSDSLIESMKKTDKYLQKHEFTHFLGFLENDIAVQKYGALNRTKLMSQLQVFRIVYDWKLLRQ